MTAWTKLGLLVLAVIMLSGCAGTKAVSGSASGDSGGPVIQKRCGSEESC